MTVATLVFMAVMLLGMAGLALLVQRSRAPVAPPPPLSLPAQYAEVVCGSLYDEVVADLGDPYDIDWTVPA